MSQRSRINSSGSEDRLERLIDERLQAGADKRLIDQRIWELFGEDWCVMYTDLSGFSRRVMEFGIIHFLQTIYESECLLIPVIESSGGILLKVEGDSMLVIFRNPSQALKCSITLQQLLHKFNKTRLPEEQILLCLGLGFGRVLRIGDSDVFGVEVNSACKLGEDFAVAWEILCTGPFARACETLPHGVAFEPLPQAPAGTDSAFKVIYPVVLEKGGVYAADHNHAGSAAGV